MGEGGGVSALKAAAAHRADAQGFSKADISAVVSKLVSASIGDQTIMSSSYSFRRNVLRWCKLLLGQLLNIGLSLTWVTAVSAEESNVIHEAVSPAVREFEINGTKLYVPLGWLIQISGERGRSDQTNRAAPSAATPSTPTFLPCWWSAWAARRTRSRD